VGIKKEINENGFSRKAKEKEKEIREGRDNETRKGKEAKRKGRELY
jgi:hypothetical protein